MGMFKEANERLYKDVYVCMKTKRKIRIPINKFLSGKFNVRKGISKQLRAVKKKDKKT